MGGCHGSCHRGQQLFAVLDEMKCGAAGRTGTKPRQAGQELDQAFYFTAAGLGHIVLKRHLETGRDGQAASDVFHIVGDHLFNLVAEMGVLVILAFRYYLLIYNLLE